MSSTLKSKRCEKVACYNDRNGRECWEAHHEDGNVTFEHESMEAAQAAAEQPSHEIKPRHHVSWC